MTTGFRGGEKISSRSSSWRWRSSLSKFPERRNSTVCRGGCRRACASSDTHNVSSHFSSLASDEVRPVSGGPRHPWLVVGGGAGTSRWSLTDFPPLASTNKSHIVLALQNKRKKTAPLMQNENTMAVFRPNCYVHFCKNRNKIWLNAAILRLLRLIV